MRKKWTYVAIVSMMLGVAPVEELRGAKAELLKAKAQVQLALAEVEAANARYRDQETAWMKAKADYEAQVAREKELQNDLLEAKNEIEKQKAQAEYDAYLEELARQKELLDAQLAVDLKNLEADMKQAEINLEVLRQELELAKVTGSEATQATIAALQADVETAYVKLYGGYLTVTSTTTSTGIWGDQTTTTEKQKKVIGALPEYYYAKKAEQEALAYQAQGFDCTIKKNNDGSYTVTAQTEGFEWTGTLSAYVEQARAELDAANKLLTDLETYGDKEVEGTDWKAEVEKLQAEIEKLEADMDVQLAQLDQAHATPEYLAALQAVDGVWENAPKGWTPGATDVKGYNYKEITNGKKTTYQLIVEKGARQLLIDANNALMAKQQQKLFSYDAYKAATEVTDEMKSAIDAAITELNANKLPGQPNYVYPANGFEYVAKKDIAWGVDKNSQNQDIPSTVAKYPSDLQAIANNYVQWITMVDAATIDPNEVAQAEAAMKRAQEEQKAANEAYTAAKEGWETLQEIIAGEKAYSVPTTDFTKSTTAYSTAFAALDKAIKDWNTAVDNAYQTAYDEAISEWKFELRIDAMDEVETSVPEFDIVAFRTQWSSVAGTAYATEARFQQIVDACCGTGEDAADIAADVWEIINTYADRETTVPDSHPRMQLVLAAAKDAVTKGNADYFDAKSTYETALSTAKDAVEDAVWTGTTSAGVAVSSLSKAISEFNADATDYVQVPADKSKQAINVLIGIADNTGKFSGFADQANSVYYTTATDNETGKVKYTINVNDITADEITAATTTKYDTTPNAGENALLAESKRVFGMDEARYVEPSRETIEAALEAHQGDAAYIAMYNASFAAKSFAADDKVAGLQNQIDASDDLDALHKELVAAQAAFKKSVEDQYAANFGELEAAVAAANTDLAEKQKALDAEDAKFHDMDVAIAKLQAQIDAEKALLETLQKAAWKYLNITWPEDNSTVEGNEGNITYKEPSGNYDPEQFAKDLQEAIEFQKLVVADAEKTLALAQAEYDKAAATGYNGCDLAAMYVQAADTKRKTAEEAYTRALTALQNALDILAASDATEQPAE